MRELYQCTGCGWLTTVYRALTWTGCELLCSNCLKRAKEGEPMATDTKTLRELMDEASSAIDVYKNPDLDDLRERLNPVLKAAGIGSTGNDHIAAIDFYSGMGGYYEIRTEWSARNCAQTSEYRLPLSIVDAEDPMEAARAWKHAKALSKAEEEVQRCADALGRARASLQAAKTAQESEHGN